MNLEIPPVAWFIGEEKGALQNGLLKIVRVGQSDLP